LQVLETSLPDPAKQAQNSSPALSAAFALDLHMPRPPRLYIPGLTQHVVQRGNNRGDIFRSPCDYECFLYSVRDAASRFELEIHAYALMTNHVHLMVTPSASTALPKTMQAIGRRYVPYFNQRYGRTGGLFEGRYRSALIESEGHWISCMRYIELNPVRAGLVDAPNAYPWTSYRAHALETSDLLVTDHQMYLRLGSTPSERARSWRAFCEQGVPDKELAEIREAVRRTRVVNPIVLPGPNPQRDDLESSHY
jgi:putative transposase